MDYDDKLLATIWRAIFVFIAFFGIAKIIHELDPHGYTWTIIGMFAVVALLAKFAGLPEKHEKE